MNIKTAIFDMDGTLVDSLMVWDVLWTSFGSKYCNDPTFRPTVQDDKKVRTLTLKDAMHLIHDHYHLGNSGDELFLIATEMIHDFYMNQVELKPGVKDLLNHFQLQGVNMCVVSATALELIHIALKHCGIDTYFHKIFSCVDIGKGKEFPDAFLTARAYFGSNPAETWVFEDSFTAIETATKIGMSTVGVYDRYNFDHDKLKQLATMYIDCGETFSKLI